MSETPAPTIGVRQRLKRATLTVLSRAGFKDEHLLLFLSVLIGVITGVGAHLFYELIEIAREVSFGDAGQGGLFAGHWYMLVLLPMIGGAVTGFITHRFAREAKGHGVPEVMDAIHQQGGRVRPRVAVAKATASALTIGSGGSAGTEGPIVQIGAAIGSGFGQWLNVHRTNMSTLVACGAAAGIAAIFNTPIAGVLFALEIFLRDFSLRTFSPVVFASVISCSLTHALRAEDGGDVAIFQVVQGVQYVFIGTELPYYLVLGLLCGLISVAFIKALYWTEDRADQLKVPEYLTPVLGAAGLGAVGVAFMILASPSGAEVPPFFGNGYPVIRDIIGPHTILEMGIGSLLILCALKMAATCLTLGSGGSGGILAPSLFMGATVGGAFGLLLNQLGLVDAGSVSAYALVGMAAVVAGTTHAPLTGIVILYELTREPKVILPVMFAAIVATTFAMRLCRDSIYTLKLRRRGVRVGTLADLTILKRISANEVRTARSIVVNPDDPLQKLIDLAVDNETGDFVVEDEHGVFQGLVVAADIRQALLQPEAVPLLVVGELVRSGVPVIKPTESLDNVLDAFATNNVQSLPLASPDDPGRIDGLITRQSVMARYHKALEQQSG